MPGLVPGIHAEQGPQFWEIKCGGTAWMAGTSPAMTAGFHEQPGLSMRLRSLQRAGLMTYGRKALV